MDLPAARRYEFPPFRLDTAARQLLRDGQPVALTNKAADTLIALVERRGRLVGREELMQLVWPDAVVEDGNLSVTIFFLRKALGDDAEAPRFIETVPRRGYRFIAEVHDPAPPPETVGETPSPPASPRRPSRRPLLAAAALLVPLVLLLAAVLRRPAGPNPAERAAQRRTVAVLGFKNLTGRPDSAWLSGAFTEMLVTELAVGTSLRTIPGENVAQAKLELQLPEAESLSQGTLARVRANLGSDLIVAGSYVAMEEAGGRVRLDLHLQDATSGETLLSLSESGGQAELFEVVARCGERLRATLGLVAPAADEAAKVRASLPSNSAAARLYAEGLAAMRTFDVVTAKAKLEAAVTADPSHALTRAALAAAWQSLGYDKKASEEARRAFDLSAELPREDALNVEGRYRETIHEWPRAIEVYRSLWEFFPDNVEYGLHLVRSQVFGGQVKDALHTLERLRKLAGASSDPRVDLVEAAAAIDVSDLKGAMTAASRAAEEAERRGARLLKAEAQLLQGESARRQGDSRQAKVLLAEARQAYQAVGDHFDALRAQLNLGNALLAEGNLDEASAVYTTCLAAARTIGNKRGEGYALNNLGVIAYNRGDGPTARQRYEEALAVKREIADLRGVASVLHNLANIVGDEGDLEGALARYDESLALERQIGNEQGVAETLTNIGGIRFEQGRLEQAQQSFEQALSTAQRLNYRSLAAHALQGLGEVSRVRAELENARQRQQQALKLREELHEADNEAESWSSLAGLALAEDKLADAERWARQAAERFHTEEERRNEAAALELLARSLLAQGRGADADQALTKAEALMPKGGGALGLRLAITRASALATSGQVAAAAAQLQTLAEQATRQGQLGLSFEARLAALRAETTPALAARAGVLQRDAQASGFLLLARQAAALAAGKS
jgi:DNA-binding winged helix-turn-helix (wHTH) protein/tetratricopeptide (TPR) repeat protein